MKASKSCEHVSLLSKIAETVTGAVSPTRSWARSCDKPSLLIGCRAVGPAKGPSGASGGQWGGLTGLADSLLSVGNCQTSHP